MKRSLLLVAASLLLGFALNAENTHRYSPVPQMTECRDTSDILFIGNSFTYYYETFNMLFELAQSQGHYINVNAQYEGGYSFGLHLIREKTMKAIERRPGRKYDVVFLQNQSQLNARIALDPERFAIAVNDAERLASSIRQYSPDARLIFEQTWSFYKYDFGGFASLEEFDRLNYMGTKKLADLCKGDVSPIGMAFSIIRNEKPSIELLHTDRHHQSPLGAYIKACVNYVMLFGRFKAGVSDCGFDHDTARYIRSVAEKVVAKEK